MLRNLKRRSDSFYISYLLMTTTLKPHEHNLIWIDLEMTGLLPETDRIIEMAVVMTDAHLQNRVEGPVLVVHQSDEVLEGMDVWNKSTHRKSGLTERVRASVLSEAEVEAQMLSFLKEHIKPQTSPMCGNSICQDRRFLARCMPKLEAFFHYRNLDVSTLKELARRWAPPVMSGFKKAQAHTALADIHESIDELVYYREHLFKL
jgi:oligoribonuclease